MDPKYFGFIEAGFSFVAIMAFLGWQLWSLRDKPPKDGDKPE